LLLLDTLAIVSRGVAILRAITLWLPYLSDRLSRYVILAITEMTSPAMYFTARVQFGAAGPAVLRGCLRGKNCVEPGKTVAPRS
jgi:hypothetical protein